VTGLTGIDIPALINNATGGASEPSGKEPRPPRRGGGSGSSGGSGGSGGSAPSGGASRPPAASGGAASATASGSEAPQTEAWGAKPPTPPTPPTPPVQRIETPAAADAAMAAADAAIAAADKTMRTGPAAAPAPRPKTDTASGPARPAPGRPASADITKETTVNEAAVKLATDLRAVPGIERFAKVRLADLETGGPRPLRAIWEVSRDQLEKRYGNLTIGELIDTYGGGAPPPH
jgi:hypothetical protein